jgi:predicted CoA-binding protein
MAIGILAKKLLVKPGYTVKPVNAPKNFAQLLGELPEGTKLAGPATKNCDLVNVFVKDSAELAKHFDAAVAALKPGGVLWVSYPKKSGSIPTDLTRDKGWEYLYKAGYVGVSLVSVNDDWSSFRCRPGTKEEIKAQQDWKPTPKQDTAGRVVTVPPDFAQALAKVPAAHKTFEAFAYTHRKEYVQWITEAKKPETRARHIEKAVQMITTGKKYS